MVATVARLKHGNLLLSGEVKERLPAVADGLVAYYPLDGQTWNVFEEPMRSLDPFALSFDGTDDYISIP